MKFRLLSNLFVMMVLSFAAGLSHADDTKLDTTRGDPMRLDLIFANPPPKATPAPTQTAPAASAEPKVADTKSSDSSQTSSSDESNYHFSIAVFYNAAKKIKFNNVQVSYTIFSTSKTGSVEESMDPGPGISFEFSSVRKNRWGYSVGAAYEDAKRINSMDVSLSGTATNTIQTQTDAIAFVYGSANALYRWERFYVPFGLNAAMPIYKTNTGIQSDLKGGIGGQVGVGFFFTEKLALEAWYRQLNFTMASSYNNVNTNYGTGTIQDFAGAFRYNF